MNSLQMAPLQEAFNTFDEDGSGFVDLQELTRCLRSHSCQKLYAFALLLSATCSVLCCRSLNVNDVTDAQIERRFKEVSCTRVYHNAALTSACTLLLSLHMLPTCRQMWMAVERLILLNFMDYGFPSLAQTKQLCKK